MKRIILLFCAAFYILSLAGCDRTPPSQLKATELSNEEQAELYESGLAANDYKFYDYQVGYEIQGLVIKCYILGEDHQWVLGESLTIDRDQDFSSKGTVDVRIDQNQTIVLNASGSSQTFPLPDYFTEAQKGSSGTSWLMTEEIVPNQETQLMLRILSSNSGINMPDTDLFLDADMSQYHAAIGITVTFVSPKPIS